MMLALFGALVPLGYCSTVPLTGGRRWSGGQARRSAKQTEPLPGAEAEAWGPGAGLVATAVHFLGC